MHPPDTKQTHFNLVDVDTISSVSELTFTGVQRDPVKYNIVYLWLILYDHALLALKGGLKNVKVIFYGI